MGCSTAALVGPLLQRLLAAVVEQLEELLAAVAGLELVLVEPVVGEGFAR